MMNLFLMIYLGIYLSSDRDVAFSFLKPGPNRYSHSIFGPRMGCIVCAEVIFFDISFTLINYSLSLIINSLIFDPSILFLFLIRLHVSQKW